MIYVIVNPRGDYRIAQRFRGVKAIIDYMPLPGYSTDCKFINPAVQQRYLLLGERLHFYRDELEVINK